MELIKGKAYYEGATDTAYKMQIVGNEFDWLERIRDKKLNEIDSDVVSQFREYATMTDAQRKAVFFGLLDHGCWWQEIGEEKVRRQWATYSDLMPFVGLQTILQSIFKGYTINAGTISNLLTRLYVTGAWKAPENADVLAEDNECEVSCTGRNLIGVTANGITEVVVGTKLNEDNTADNAAYCEVFDNIDTDPYNRIFTEEQEVIVEDEAITHHNLYFTPSIDAVTAYTLRLKYTTQMVIMGNTPVFADTLHFGGKAIAQLGIEDSNALAGGMLNSGLFRECKYPDSLTQISSGGILESEKRNFLLKVSNPENYAAVVQVIVSINGKGDYYYTTQVITTNVSKEMYIRGAVNFDYDKDSAFLSGTNNHPAEGVRAAIGLLTNSNDVYIVSDNERALRVWTPRLADRGVGKSAVKINTFTSGSHTYANISVQMWQVGEDNMLTFNVSALTPAYRLYEQESMSLAVGFSSSNARMLGTDELLVSVSDGTLAPKFNNAKPFGEDITLNDVAGETNATDALKAIMQLFNLRVYANPDTKEVNLLPYDEFYSNTAVDWRDRVDLDKGVEMTTIGDDIGNALKLTYQEATPAAQHYNARHNMPYLAWRRPLLSKRSNKEYELQNVVFSAPMTIQSTDIFPNSTWGGGKLLNVVSADTQETLDNLDYDSIPPVLTQVMYPTGDPTETIQYVGTTGLLADYIQPEITITDREQQTTISFGDTGGAKGLHKHYDKQIDAWNYGKRIVCYCRVYPQEIESLRKAGMTPVDFRSRYLLHIGGEDIYCRLESIENYEPQNATHKCTFVY